jgi:esterase/lipase
MFLWLIMFGAADQQVDAKQPLGLKLQLHEPHKDHSLILFNNSHHLLTADRLDHDSQASLGSANTSSTDQTLSFRPK